jgi:hypothetical protein
LPPLCTLVCVAGLRIDDARPVARDVAALLADAIPRSPSRGLSLLPELSGMFAVTLVVCGDDRIRSPSGAPYFDTLRRATQRAAACRSLPRMALKPARCACRFHARAAKRRRRRRGVAGVMLLVRFRGEGFQPGTDLFDLPAVELSVVLGFHHLLVNVLALRAALGAAV